MMGQIFNIRNFNAYTGRYSRKPNRRTPESQIGWYIDGAVGEKLPILALRNRERDDEWPPVWRPGRNTRIAVAATLDSLKAWKAFRPYSAQSLLRPLSKAVPRVLASFQRKSLAADITCIHDALKVDWQTYSHILIAMADAVGKVSILKSNQPMLGSKIMHFLLPEFFPVWDTLRIKPALANETESLGRWMPTSVSSTLSRFQHAKPAIQYARYVALMAKDLAETSRREYQGLERAYVHRSKVHERVVCSHFHDLAPSLFEVCLLGKHNARRA